MLGPGLAIVLILAAGAILVVVPTILTTFFEYRSLRRVSCPELGRTAVIGVDAAKAARNSLFGRIRLRVESCSFWPARRGCDQACLESLEPATPRFQA
jgi:hypothetical protein